MDDRGWDTKFPLEINQGNEEAYAELLMVAAQISLTHGQANQAYDELHEASCLDPENEEVKLLLEKCRRLKEYRDKSPKWIEQSRRNEQQHEGMWLMNVMYNAKHYSLKAGTNFSCSRNRNSACS